jgi:hypothetical protein
MAGSSFLEWEGMAVGRNGGEGGGGGGCFGQCWAEQVTYRGMVFKGRKSQRVSERSGERQRRIEGLGSWERDPKAVYMVWSRNLVCVFVCVCVTVCVPCAPQAS